MTYSEDEIRRRLLLGEDSHWEFKQIEFAGNRPRSPKRDDLADEVAAFANGTGGVMMCGITDDGRVQGMTRGQLDAMEKLVTEICSDSIKPPTIEIDTLRFELDGKAMLIVKVPAGYALHKSPGGSYRRIGSSKRKMTSDEELRIAQRRGQARFPSFDEQTLPETGFQTLEESLWKPLLTAEGAVNPETALRKLALLAPDDAKILRATVAGVLLCTPNPEQWLPGACITATRYRGRDRSSGQIDAQEIAGPLNRQIAAAIVFAARNMRVAARKEPGRVDLPQYSHKALFEAVVNAVAHRDYSMHAGRIRMSMFEDRLEIQSPGSLPNNLTIDSMSMRQATRNEALTSILRRMRVDGVQGSADRQFFMERRGDGVPIIQRETKQLTGKLPEYILIDDSEVRLTIPAAPLDPSAAQIVVTVWSSGQPVSGAKVLIVFPNKTWKSLTTNEDGEASVTLHTTDLPLTVFAAAPGYAAHVRHDWTPSQGALAVNLDRLPEGGAVIFPEATGEVPGLTGRLTPIMDDYDRTCLYASNISVNEGRPQPIDFILGEELRLTDAEGRKLQVRIVAIMGRSALVEYRSFV